MTSPGTSPKIKDRPAPTREPVWRAVVHNDPVNLMGYVVLVFKKVLGMTQEEAVKHMLEVHHQGHSIVWTGPREPAEHRVHELQHWHLQATLEPDDADL